MPNSAGGGGGSGCRGLKTGSEGVRAVQGKWRGPLGTEPASELLTIIIRSSIGWVKRSVSVRTYRSGCNGHHWLIYTVISINLNGQGGLP